MIKVLKPGFYSSVQDLGRFGSQQYGVPISGVMDSLAAELANTLIGNSKNDAVIEMTMIGPVLEFRSNTLICISGADMSPMLNKTEVKLNKVIHVETRDILSFGKLKQGFRCYLAVFGGIKTKQILKSRSMYKGITPDFVLRKGDLIETKEYKQGKITQNASIKFNTSYLTDNKIEVYKGPEFDLLSDKQNELLLCTEFEISKDNNRMAYQLLPKIDNNLEPIITSLVLPGTVQLTPSGTLIVLMRDCQTTGGYPRVLQLSEKGINLLSQKFSGQRFSFYENESLF